MDNYESQQWENQLLERFMEIVKAPYGDFAAIGNLSRATSDTESLQQIIESLSRHPQAKSAIQERFQLGKIDLLQLHRLPTDTLGYAYAAHMLDNGLKPLQIPSAEDDYTYLGLHMTEIHDIWHVVTGADTSIEGEIQLHAFTAAQLHFARFYLTMLARSLLKTAIDAIEQADQHMDALTRGWMMGKQAHPLFGIRWNTLWEMPLEHLRAELNIPTSNEKTVLAMGHLSS
jgi:ubiquinone biosynthesis protein Coq4